MQPLSDMHPPKAPAERHVQHYYDGTRRLLYITNEHYILNSGTIIVSRTDPQGIITHANRAFVETCGYSERELLGSPHYIIRHPDMPRAAFKDLWDTVKQGVEWHGYVKNLRKDGGYYWVYATVAPIVRGDTIMGYTSVRRKVSDRIIAEYERKYATMRLRESLENSRRVEEKNTSFFSRLFGWKK